MRSIVAIDKASPNLATLSVDAEAKTVHTEAMQYWSATARFIDDKHVLD